VDLTCELERDATVEQVNAAMKAAAEGPMKGILAYEESELVSIDFVGNPHSAIVDAAATSSVAGLVKVVAWYDKEWGYSQRCVDLARYVGERL
jgi:glyceraldehyde 3-phosphate dehydrogenase